MKGKDTLLTLVIGLGLWQAAVTLTDVPHFILPSPSRVAQALFIHRATIFDHTLATATEVVLGLVIGTILGTVTAVQLALFRTAERLILPILVFTQAVPVFALAPLLTLWFGYGIGSKIVMTVLIIFFPVTSAFHDGLTRTDNRFHDLAHAMGARKVRFMWHVQIPSALPDLGTGLKLAAVYAPIGAVIGEFVGATEGMGFLLDIANSQVDTPLVWASLAFFSALGLILFGMVVLAERILMPWADSVGHG